MNEVVSQEYTDHNFAVVLRLVQKSHQRWLYVLYSHGSSREANDASNVCELDDLKAEDQEELCECEHKRSCSQECSREWHGLAKPQNCASHSNLRRLWSRINTRIWAATAFISLDHSPPL